MTLSASHTADLSHVGPLPMGPDDSILGRALAGGKLLMETLIGRGGVGAVYKARHRELRMAVAVKVLHESFQQTAPKKLGDVVAHLGFNLHASVTIAA